MKISNPFGISLLALFFVSSVFGAETNQADEVETERGSPWLAAPLVVMNPAFGNGFGAVGLYFFKPDPTDTVSPASTLGLVGLYSDTDSHFAGLFSQIYLKEDLWRVAAGAINGKINNEFNVEGFSRTVEFSTKVNAVFTRIDRRIAGNYFLGTRIGVVDMRYIEGNALSKIYFNLFNVEDDLSGQFALIGFHDSRDDVRYPESGNYSEATLSFIPEWLGSAEGYHALELFANQYISPRERQVLALRAFGRFTPSDTPYSGLSTLGRQSDLRGYTSGEKLAENLITLQAEYRWFFTKRMGAVGFAGISELYNGSIGNINKDTFYPSAGLGLRYMLNEENKMNFRFDYAWGSNDESGFYIGVGESF
ncbi:BamA/TamA family outer membrane protein [Pontiellaceae bacterium B12227]|nr:BamA/TamA family outer membrane protein [Pontiellaceae bacterium B12227]